MLSACFKGIPSQINDRWAQVKDLPGPYSFLLKEGSQKSQLSDVNTSGCEWTSKQSKPDQDTSANREGFMATRTGTNGNDILRGTFREDTLFGLNGDDLLRGQGGDDPLLSGGGDNDHVLGGEGDDQLYGNNGSDQLRGENGDDRLHGGNGNDYLLGGRGTDTLSGGHGDDRLDGGVDGNDQLYGNNGNDQLKGNAQANYLNGGEGSDRLYGSGGRDTLTGANGDDRLDGGKGADSLTGGKGSDRFVISSPGGSTLAAADLITDFDNKDLLELGGRLKLNDLNIAQGQGDNRNDTIITDKLTGQFLTVLQGVERSTITKADFLASGILEFSTANFSVREDGTSIAAVTVTRSGRSDSAASATIRLADNTTTPADYQQKPVTVKFAEGEVEQTVQIPLIDDRLVEGPETVQLSLDAPSSGAAIGEQNTATLEIIDDDRYAITDIGVLDGDGSVEDINNAGQVVGSSDPIGGDTNYQAFIWDNLTGKRYLGTLGGDSSRATAINSVGQVTGVAETASGRDRAFLWSKNTGMKSLGVPDGENAAALDTAGEGINDKGQVIGDSSTIYFNESGQQVYEAPVGSFIWDKNTGFTTIEFGSYKYDSVSDINNSGQVAGNSSDQYGGQAYRWSKSDGATKLDDLANESHTYARSINDLDQVVGGSYTLNGGLHAFLWNQSGATTDLGTLKGKKYTDSGANDINNAGQVVGYSEIANDIYRAFLYQGGTMQNLNSLLPANSSWTLESANAINDFGQIVGTGALDGQTHAFLATPV